MPLSTRRFVAAMALRGALLCPFLAGFGCSEVGEPPAAGDVILLTLDTLRGDRWGALGDPSARTPHLDRISRGGRLAFEGRAPAPLTLPSHVSMMTGLPPAIHGVRDNGIFRLAPEGATTVAEEYQRAGWTTAAFVSAYPLVARFGLDRGFDVYLDGLGQDAEAAEHLRERDAEATVDRAERWLGGAQSPPADEPLFLWLHFFDPHAEYRPPGQWIDVLPDGYRAEVAYLDHEIGRFLRVHGDRRSGRSVRLLIASDHGESLGDGGEATHGVLVRLSAIRVPIVVCTSTYAPALDDRPVPLERVAATLAGLAGIEAELHAAAAPPLSAEAGPVHAETLYPHFNFGWRGLRVREEAGWRLVNGGVDRLYRVDEDPGELHDVAAAHPDVVRRMRDALEDEWEARCEAALAVGSGELSPEEVETLRSLGYASAGGIAVDAVEAAFEAGPDPGERIGDLGRVNRAITLFSRGRSEEAIPILEAIVAVDPGNRMAWEYYGRALLATQEAEKARDALRTAAGLGPNPAAVYIDLAAAERRLGDGDGEWAALQAALDADPRSVPARTRMVVVLLARNEVREAREIILEVARLRPHAARPHMLLARVETRLGNADEARRQWELVIELDREGSLQEIARASLVRLEEEEGGGGS